ncbi:uncharacterized protein LOC144142516 isoform X2 [Haemaphysalis longicornis]
MGALVQYRDLPGGPTELRLCDELSRHCMCTNCGMLSMSMLQDPNQHMFCETCLMDRSIKYKSDHIYCSYENREVDISEMFEASDLITVIRDQYVKCPNPKCKEYVTLQELKEHYTQCLPAVMCSTCHQQVPSADWSNHNNKCNKQEASGTKSMGAIRKHFQPKEAVPYPNSSPSVKRDSNQNSRETSSLYPSLQEAQRPPQKPTTEDTMLCPYCKRKIKIINLDGHLEKCSKVPHPCIYCKAQFSKEEIKSHVAICESNPDSVHKQKPEKLEVRNTSVAHPPQDHGGRRANVGPANRNASNGARPPSEVLNTSKTNPPQDSGGRRGNEKPGNRNTNQGAKPQSEGPPRKACAQVGHPAAKGASKSCPDPQQHKVRADSPIWLELMSSGNLLAAFAAFEESCSEKKISEDLMYTQFTTRLVDTKCREMVKDLLEKPCSTQPLYCLMVALFARVCLPPKVWAKSEDKVTWNDVLKYLPSILVSRLSKRKVMAYLREYPVFLDQEEASPVVDAHCDTKEYPFRTSHSSNSTHPAAPKKVADPLWTGKDGQDSSEVPQGNHSDGGESPGEERSSLHTGEKAAFQKHPAKLEAELADKRKCHDTENSSKKDFEKGIIKTGPPFGSYTEYTQKQSASEQMEAATDQACAIAMPSKFNTEPSCKEGTILIGFQDKGNFSRAMVREETSLKAENTSTSVDDSDLKECSELSSGLQPSKNNRVNTTCKDSNISKRLDNLSSAAKGPVQADSFSKSALSPPGAEVSHEKLICSTERTTPSTQNEPAFMGKPEKLDGHPKGIVPENVTKGAKCRTYENETTSASGSNDSGILEDMAKIAIEPPEDRNTSSSLSDRFRRNLRERRLFSQQIRSYKILRKIHSYKILRKTRSYKILRKRALFLRQIMSPHQPRRMYGQFIELTA